MSQPPPARTNAFALLWRRISRAVPAFHRSSFLPIALVLSVVASAQLQPLTAAAQPIAGRDQPRVYLASVSQGLSTSPATQVDGTYQTATAGLVIKTALKLQQATVAHGGSLTAAVTYANTGSAPVSLRNIVVAARPPGGTNWGGPYLDFPTGTGQVTLPPGGEATLTTTRTFQPSDPTGTWYAFSSYQDSAGAWYEAPAALNVSFTVTSTAATPTPTTAAASPTPMPGSPIIIKSPLRLQTTSAGIGGSITAVVTYANASSAAVTLRNIVVAARPPGGTNWGGPYLDFPTGTGQVTLPPGGETTLTTTRTFQPSDPTGTWYAFSSYQDSAGNWHEAPAAYNVTFTIGGAGAAATPTPTTAAPSPTATSTAIATKTLTPSQTGAVVIKTALKLQQATVAHGGSLTAAVTYANTGSAPVSLRNIVVAARPPGGTNWGGPYLDFPTGTGQVTLPPGGEATLTTTRTFQPSDPTGTWYAFSSYQDSAGAWYEAPAALNVSFTVTSTAVTPAPSGSSIYWGAYINGVPWDPQALPLQDQFEQRAGKRASLIHWGVPWFHQGSYHEFYPEVFDRVRTRGALPLVDWGSFDWCCGPDQPQFRLAEIANGRHDAYVRRWASAAKAWGHPLFLRFNWEMNGHWQFPWAEPLNGNQPGDYVRAWRHVHEIFRQVGATNVSWVWCPNIVGPQTVPLGGLYPGDAYVDWVGLDGYNWGTAQGGHWQTAAELFQASYDELGRLAPSKPIMLAETASAEAGGSKAAWIEDLLLAQLPNRFPRVKALVWFNWNDNNPALSWPIESSPEASAAFARGIGSAYYRANEYAHFATSPIPPP